jgi:hypothetical protein
LGRVTDQSGAVVPGAQVTLRNQGTGLVLTTRTASDGDYVFPALKIGAYRVEIEASGFETFVEAGIALHVRQDALINATLVPGRMNQTIQVKGVSPILQTQNSSVGQIVGTNTVNDLPLNGRDWTSLAEISTGVSVGEPDNSLNRILFSAAGHDMWTNDYRVNGIVNMTGQANPRGYIALPPPDAMSEFKIETENYSADLGFGGGAVIDATMKSGTNQIHGDAWDYVRNSTFDAAQFFENSTGEKKGLYEQNQFGFTLGGPVVIPHFYNGRDKTFFFVDYQGLRYSQASPFIETVPTSTMVGSGYTDLQDLITDQSGTQTDDLGRTFPLGTVFDPATTRLVTAGQVDPITGLIAKTSGYVRDPFYEGTLVGTTNFTSAATESRLNMLPTDRLDPNAIKLLGLYPLPDQPGYINDYAYDPSATTSTNQTDYRVDENFSPRDQMFFYGTWEGELNVEPPYIPGLGGAGDYYGEGPNSYGWQAYAISETHSFSPTMVNETRLGWARSEGDKTPTIAGDLGIPAEFGIQGIPQTPGNEGLPDLNIGGLTGLGVSATSQLFYSTVWDLTENLTNVHGTHTFKAGFQGDQIRYFIKSGGPSTRGDFCFTGAYTSVPNTSGANNGVAQLLLSPTATSVPGGFNDAGGANSVSASNFYQTDAISYYFGTYFMDDWRVTPKLTLNLGLRWDHDTPEIDRHGNEADFIPGSPGNGAEYVIGQHLCTSVGPSFTALGKEEGIAVGCAPVSAFGSFQKANFAPRVGLAYRFTSKLVGRGGYGIFYDEGVGAGEGQDNMGPSTNYPNEYFFSFPSPSPGQPITYANGSIATLENGLSAVSFSPATVNAEGLTLAGRQWIYEAPYYEDYNLSVQYQVSPNQTFTLGYVGDQAHHMMQNITSNDPDEILPPGLNSQNYVPYPDFARGATYESTSGDTYYNSLQATFERRFSGGLDLNGNYTYSKCRSDYRNVLSDETLGSFRAPYLPGFGIQGDYGYCDADEPNLVHVSGMYQLPFGKGMHFLTNSSGLVNSLLGGWQANGILTLQDGQPFNIGCPVSTTADFGCWALLVPGQNVYAGPHNVNDWLNAAAFATPPVATAIGQSNYAPLGGSPSQAHGPGDRRLDFSLFKEFPITESKHFEFRAEFFNLTNTPWFANPSQTNFANPKLFGEITSVRDGANDPREIQFALKFFW